MLQPKVVPSVLQDYPNILTILWLSFYSSEHSNLSWSSVILRRMDILVLGLSQSYSCSPIYTLILWGVRLKSEYTASELYSVCIFISPATH